MRVLQRIAAVLTLACLTCTSAVAQEFSAIARLDVAQSGADDRFRATAVDLYLSQPVPYRVFTLDDPRRLIVDFREVDFRGATPGAFTRSARVAGARFGALRPGWSRMILSLTEPLRVEAAGMEVNDVDGTARIAIRLRGTSPEAFTAASGAPFDPDWAFDLTPPPPQPAPEGGPRVVMIDPGHGGIDPGAEQGGIHEADVMLALALELSAALGRVDGVEARITRAGDVFVPLQERLTLARAARADLFISLHADALEGEQATGASVYTLSQDAEDAASQRMAERHDRSDVLAGVDLTGQDDEVTTVLQDLVRVETAASGERFATALVAALQDSGAVVNSRPRREAELAVLNSADFPSVLLEVGFLSNPDDRARLTTPEGRAPIVEAVALAVARWAIEEEALAPLVRQ